MYYDSLKTHTLFKVQWRLHWHPGVVKALQQYADIWLGSLRVSIDLLALPDNTQLWRLRFLSWTLWDGLELAGYEWNIFNIDEQGHLQSLQQHIEFQKLSSLWETVELNLQTSSPEEALTKVATRVQFFRGVVPDRLTMLQRMAPHPCIYEHHWLDSGGYF